MKATCFTIILSIALSPAFTQYYYKDQLITKQTNSLLARYKAAKVRIVELESYEGDGQPTEGFKGTQSVSGNYTQMVTAFESVMGDASELTSYFDAAGRISRTTDTTDGSGSVNEYYYSPAGKLSRIINTSTSAGGAKEKEEHLWMYDVKGTPEKMLRIKNNTDTTVITFVKDDKGNVAEENSARKSSRLPSIYYYYDDQNRLTDIVTYSEKAKRLLPLYVFEYGESDAIRSLMIVPEGSDDYQKWYYTYNSAGLKVEEKCFNKRKQIVGSIKYNYRN